MTKKQKIENKLFDLRGALYVQAHLLEIKKRSLNNSYKRADKLVKQINTLENILLKYSDY